jgi:peroxiredoxin Q/BCP
VKKRIKYCIRSAMLIAGAICMTIPVLKSQVVYAADAEMNQTAPNIELPNQDGKVFKLSDRKGKWTVIFFYPKAGSPGCTEQACAFRDSIKKIEARNAILVGISADKQESQKEFHKKHNLSFDLLSDPDGKVLSAYGVRLPLIGVARRTTFIVDPEMKIRSIAKDVDPAFDAEWSAETLDELQEGEAPRKDLAPAMTAPAKIESDMKADDAKSSSKSEDKGKMPSNGRARPKN